MVEVESQLMRVAAAAVLLAGCTNYYDGEQRSFGPVPCGVVVQAAAEVAACIGEPPLHLEAWRYEVVSDDPWMCECARGMLCACNGQTDYATRTVRLDSSLAALGHELIHAGWNDPDHKGKHWRCQ